MKTKNQTALFMCAGFVLVTLLFSKTFAQDKPKGKEWNVPEESAKVKNPVKTDDASLGSGKEIWSQQCKSCHGVKGLGDGTKAAKIDISCGDFSSAEIQKLSDGALYWKITEGRKPMPSFSEKLSDPERWQVVNYIRTFKKAGATTATTTKEVNTIKKDSTIINVLKTDSVNATNAEYMQLKEELEALKKEVNALKTEVDELKKTKEQK